MQSFVRATDMKRKDHLFRFTAPENLPLTFCYGGKTYRGIPAEFHPTVDIRRVDANMMQYIVTGKTADGLEIRVEYVEYLDYPGTEFLAFFTNTADTDSAILSDVRIVDGVIPMENITFVHSNGATRNDDGCRWYHDALDKTFDLAPDDGLSCRNVFPYMRLASENWGVNFAIGWPGTWHAIIEPAEGGAHISIGQKRCHTLLHPGETMRTPRLNFVAYEGDEDRGTNMWRRWYMAHILPRENGQPLPAKLCLHDWDPTGKEHTEATEESQLRALNSYLDNGLKPDIWWIDAGWYPWGENLSWWGIKRWEADPARFPNGLGPIGKKCEEEGIRFLLWFEPERIWKQADLVNEHPEWLIKSEGPYGSVDHVLNLGIPECCDWIIEKVDSIIKDSHVHIYRQDFNIAFDPFWTENESDDRIGMVENLHTQGYLRYWDTLILRNPGLWIDSCAGGGRRNDLETMRRAVPLHYTDYCYGHHPSKQLQHNHMLAWIPYFRAHNMNWDDPVTGEYNGEYHIPDRYSYYVATAPALTDMTLWNAGEAEFELARKMVPIWRKAANILNSSDFYPLTECRNSREDIYAVQFFSPERQEGFLEVLRNNACPIESFTANFRAVDEDATYILTEAESGEKAECTGKELKAGFTVTLPIRSGKIYFYERKR
ncbi:MAG: hypothetical protein E7335_00385 [Clostridiales bacterium]|nr:hypothetical protein [Clostridiales bacterium]